MTNIIRSFILFRYIFLMNNLDIKQFSQKGYFITYGEKNIKKICKKIDIKKIVDNHIRQNKKDKWSSKDGSPKVINISNGLKKNFSNLINSKYIKQCVKKIFNGKHAVLYHSKISLKFKENQSWFPHTDNAYLVGNRNKVLTICIFLEDIEKDNGELILYEKTHKLNIKHKIKFHKDEKDPQIIADINLNKFNKKHIYGKKGDVVFFDGNLVHSSGNNLKKNFRPIFIFNICEVTNNKIILDDNGEECFKYNDYKYPKNILINKIIYKIKIKLIGYAKKLLYILYKLKFI